MRLLKAAHINWVRMARRAQQTGSASGQEWKRRPSADGRSKSTKLDVPAGDEKLVRMAEGGVFAKIR